jgi:hypothetical protein
MKRFLLFSVCALLLAGCASDDSEVMEVKEMEKMGKGENLIIYNLKRDARYAAIKDKLRGIYRPRAVDHKGLEYGNLNYEEFEKIFKKEYMEQYKK